MILRVSSSHHLNPSELTQRVVVVCNEVGERVGNVPRRNDLFRLVRLVPELQD